MENRAARPIGPGSQLLAPLMTLEILDSMLDLWGETGQMQWLAISGQSMAPLIEDGDQVLVEFRPRILKPGDVIVFRRAEQLIAHRIVRLISEDDRAFVITKGDGVAAFDPPCSLKEIIGRVHAIRNGKQERPLDTRIWRTAGRAIAGLTSSLARAYSGGQTSFASRIVRKLAQESIRGLVRVTMHISNKKTSVKSA